MARTPRRDGRRSRPRSNGATGSAMNSATHQERELGQLPGAGKDAGEIGMPDASTTRRSSRTVSAVRCRQAR